MDEYKDAISTLEGRLSLRATKAPRRDAGDEAYFETRPQTRATASSWLSGSAVIDQVLPKSTDGKQPSVGSNVTKRFPNVRRGATSSSFTSKARLPQTPDATGTNGAFTVVIDLAEPNLYLEGFDFEHRTAHQSAVLRGTLRLHVRQQITLDKLDLEFKGISETVWPESWRLRHLKKNTRENITSHAWNFVDSGQKVAGHKDHHSFQPGHYNYNFELPIDTSFPETMQLPLGAVYYVLTATASQAGHITSTATHEQRVNLIRIPCACSLETVEPCGATGFQHGLRYSFMLQAHSFPVGGKVPIGIRLIPQPDCTWQRICIALEEDVRYRTRDSLAQREQCSVKAILLDKGTREDALAQRALKRISAAGESMSSIYAGSTTIDKPRRNNSDGSSFINEADCLKEKVTLQLPSCSSIHPDTAYSCLYVRHNLVITILARVKVNEHDYSNFQIRIRQPIQLLTCKLSDGTTTLPEYVEDAESMYMNRSAHLCRCTSLSRENEILHEAVEPSETPISPPDRLAVFVSGEGPPAYLDTNQSISTGDVPQP